MGQKYEWQSLANIETTAAALQEVASQLVHVAMKMRENSMEQALFPWTQRQWDSLDVMITLGSECSLVIPAQVTAKQQNRPSKYEVIKKKSAITVSQRKARQSTREPKRARGRPKKGQA